MSHDETFRIVLMAIAAVVIPIGLYHRIRSQATGEKLDRGREGLFILATLRPIGLLLALSVVAYMVSPRSMAWSSLPLPVWLRCAGVGLAIVAGGLLTWTFRSLGTNITDTVVTRRRHALITDGPYRWVRHPFYGSVALFVLGIALITANWFIVLAGAAVLSLLVVRTRKEEDNLVARFGDAYRTYMNTTGRFFPRGPSGLSAARAIALGTLVVGILDGADALIFFGLRGAPPIRIFQSIAAGLLGRPAFAGGFATAALGIAVHFFIACVIVSVAVIAARRWRVLTRTPILAGIAYGIAVYVVMNYVVLPLSNAGAARPAGIVLVNGVLIHMFGVGLPSMFFARAATSFAVPGRREDRTLPPQAASRV